MNTRLTRVLACVLAMVLCFGMLSVTAFAADSTVNMMRKPASAKMEELPLPGDKPSKIDWTAKGFWGTGILRKWVTKIEFHDTLNDVPKKAYNLSNVWENKSVYVWREDSVAHVAANGKVIFNPNSSFMFAYFPNLEEINFNGCIDTSYVERMDHMFYQCPKLAKVDLSGFDTSKVETMSGMFFGCKSLKELDVSGFNTSKVKKMTKMFAYCEALEQLNVSKLDTSRVEDLSFLFFNCKSLKSVDVSGFDTSHNLYLNSMFYGCEQLESVNVSKFDTSKTMGMCSTFSGCPNLKTPDVAGWDLSAVMDYHCFMDEGVTVNGQSWEALFE